MDAGGDVESLREQRVVERLQVVAVFENVFVDLPADFGNQLCFELLDFLFDSGSFEKLVELLETIEELAIIFALLEQQRYFGGELVVQLLQQRFEFADDSLEFGLSLQRNFKQIYLHENIENAGQIVHCWELYFF